MNDEGDKEINDIRFSVVINNNGLARSHKTTINEQQTKKKKRKNRIMFKIKLMTRQQFNAHETVEKLRMSKKKGNQFLCKQHVR